MSKKIDLNMMINAHWEYVDDLLRVYGISYEDRYKAEFMYKSAFKHGFKHALETMESK